jgi:transcriptional regulator with XRE-family HTH domain
MQQATIVTPRVTTSQCAGDNLAPMNRTYNKTYIKEWREFRGLSLRRLAQRLEIDGPTETFSHASLGRIENGKQPYSQPILEALSVALDCSVTDLLSKNPFKEGEVIDLLALINDSNRETAVRVLRALVANGDDKQVK